MNELYFGGKRYISSKRAAEISGYAKDYVGQLCRAKKIDARLVGRNWYVSEMSIMAHKKHGLEQGCQEMHETRKNTFNELARYITGTAEENPYYTSDPRPSIPNLMKEKTVTSERVRDSVGEILTSGTQEAVAEKVSDTKLRDSRTKSVRTVAEKNTDTETESRTEGLRTVEIRTSVREDGSAGTRSTTSPKVTMGTRERYIQQQKTAFSEEGTTARRRSNSIAPALGVVLCVILAIFLFVWRVDQYESMGAGVSNVSSSFRIWGVR